MHAGAAGYAPSVAATVDPRDGRVAVPLATRQPVTEE